MLNFLVGLVEWFLIGCVIFSFLYIITGTYYICMTRRRHKETAEFIKHRPNH